MIISEVILVRVEVEDIVEAVDDAGDKRYYCKLSDNGNGGVRG